jgi:hypothetical protein
VHSDDPLAGSGIDLVEPVISTSGVNPAGATGLPSPDSDPESGVNMGVGERPAHGRQWRIRCQDVADRERFVTLFVEHGRVVLVGPPGESAVLTPGQLSLLRSALQEAADEAER